MATPGRLKHLILLYRSGVLTDDQREELLDILNRNVFPGSWTDDMQQVFDSVSLDIEWNKDLDNQIWVAIQPLITKTPVSSIEDFQSKASSMGHRIHFLRTVWFRFAAAAILFIVISGSIYLWNVRQKSPASVQSSTAGFIKNDILPGSNKAILTLSNGQKIALNSSTPQIIADGKLAISDKDGMLTYGKSDIIVYNSMITPRGGQYSLALPDGTKVWLNASSSITYPTAFNGKERQVEIMGEVYFEVAKNPKKPFIVSSGHERITVLGTSFNINSYSDEPAMKTSLLEGSLRIGDKILKPGQAYLDGKVIETNLDQDIAWKNGVFNFNNADLFVVMRQLSRWYNIELKYEGRIKPRIFQGEMDKGLNLSQVIKILSETGVKFRIDGNKLTVSE